MKRAILLAAVAALAAGPALAQTEPLRLTLADAIRRGEDASHRIAEAVARGEATEAVVGERHAASLPQVTAQAAYTRTNHVDQFGVFLPPNQLRIIYPDIPDNYRTRLDVQWPIYTGGRLDALERAARIEGTASADDITAARADLALEITRAYWALVTSTESVTVVEQSLVRMGAHLADVRNQLAAGLVPPNDVLSVEAQLSRQRMLSVQARAVRDIAEAELARLVGAPPGTAIDPIENLELQPAPAQPLESLADIAKQHRAERAALTKHVAAAEARLAAAGAGDRPTIGVAGGFDYADPNPRIFPRERAWRSSWDAGLVLSWPLFDGGKTRSERAEAAATVRAARERLAEFDETVAVEVRQRLRDAEASRAAVEAATDAVRSATEARRVVGDRFNAGVATSTDVLDAQVALLQAQLDRTQAISNARLADARLTRALGQ